MDNQELLEKCIREEKEYRFDHFSRDDVWELGCALVEAARGFEGPLATEIDLNGLTVFRYYPAGTGELNEQWLERKRNTVEVMEQSSLHVFADLEVKHDTILDGLGLDPADYANCGGGFPLRLKGGCVIGFIGASGLAHTRDHESIIAGLDLYFSRHPEQKAAV